MYSPTQFTTIIIIQHLNERLRMCLISFSEGIEGSQLGLKDLLRFATGADAVPPLGFNPNPTLRFIHKEDLPMNEHHMAEFPRSNTCGLELRLPVAINSYDIFKTRMQTAMEMLTTFTNW